jgi:hypothetical protein
VSLACRCTPTLVRQARIEAERNPETGREEGSLEQARDMLERGMSLRQVAVLTGIPKSTLHRHARVASGTGRRLVSHPDVSPCPDEGRNGRAPATLVFPPRRPRSEDHDPPPTATSIRV